MVASVARVVARGLGIGSVVGAAVAAAVVLVVGMALVVVEAARGVGGSPAALLPTLVVGVIAGAIAGAGSGVVAGVAARSVVARSTTAARIAVVAVAGPTAALMVLLAYVALYGGGSTTGARWSALVVAVLAGIVAGTAGWRLTPRLLADGP
ncbi:MAG: hypothetical protein R6V28_14870 [Nitriliruptoraceae bacterium]